MLLWAAKFNGHYQGNVLFLMNRVFRQMNAVEQGLERS